MRLDKYICECTSYTRSQACSFIRKKLVTVDSATVTDPGFHVSDNNMVRLRDSLITYEKYIYLMLNKPSGYITATSDSSQKTVMDLIEEKRKDLFPVGRLDKDTEGLLLITDNGKLNHNMLSPKRHVDKTYYIECRSSLSDDDIKRLCNGLDIGDEKPTLEAHCVRTDNGILLTIHEGRYHQVKRMISALGNEVSYLKRISFGPLKLDASLDIGKCRRLTDEEIDLLKKYMD